MKRVVHIITGHTGNLLTTDSNIHFQKAKDINAMRTRSDQFKNSWHAIITEVTQMSGKCTVITEHEI